MERSERRRCTCFSYILSCCHLSLSSFETHEAFRCFEQVRYLSRKSVLCSNKQSIAEMLSCTSSSFCTERRTQSYTTCWRSWSSRFFTRCRLSWSPRCCASAPTCWWRTCPAFRPRCCQGTHPTGSAAWTSCSGWMIDRLLAYLRHIHEQLN